ncbi:MAG: helix-turn-helix domain-containing protein [Noviherbaspirillum sp.]
MKLEEFSGFVLSLRSSDRTSSIERFQERILERLRACIAFDAAWWGVGATSDDGLLTYQSFLYKLPPTFLSDWTAIAKDDLLAFEVYANPGVAVLGGKKGRSAEIIRFRARYGIHSALSICVPDPASGLGLYISLYRDAGMALFGEKERALYQLMMPHIAAAWRESWREEILRGHADRQVCYALVSEEGVLRNADPEFFQRLLLEWPDWKGALLPEQVRLVSKKKKEYRGKHIEIHIKDGEDGRSSGTARLSCIPRMAVSLTPREETIARQYAIGLSYKEIANQLDLSPATVRSYLRDCYMKLGVSNKYELGAAIDIRNVGVSKEPSAR